jgi:hypothetical protein
MQSTHTHTHKEHTKRRYTHRERRYTHRERSSTHREGSSTHQESILTEREQPRERGNMCGKGKGNVYYYDTAKGRQSPNWACCTKSTIFVKFICAD